MQVTEGLCKVLTVFVGYREPLYGYYVVTTATAWMGSVDAARASPGSSAMSSFEKRFFKKKVGEYLFFKSVRVCVGY